MSYSASVQAEVYFRGLVGAAEREGGGTRSRGGSGGAGKGGGGVRIVDEGRAMGSQEMARVRSGESALGGRSRAGSGD